MAGQLDAQLLANGVQLGELAGVVDRKVQLLGHGMAVEPIGAVELAQGHEYEDRRGHGIGDQILGLVGAVDGEHIDALLHQTVGDLDRAQAVGVFLDDRTEHGAGLFCLRDWPAVLVVGGGVIDGFLDGQKVLVDLAEIDFEPAQFAQRGGIEFDGFGDREWAGHLYHQRTPNIVWLSEVAYGKRSGQASARLPGHR